VIGSAIDTGLLKVFGYDRSGQRSYRVPKRKPAVDDHTLLTRLESLPDRVRLLPSQVFILTGISEDSLKERRRPPPKPPLAQPPLDGKPGAFVWYQLGEVRRFWSSEDAAQRQPPRVGFASFGAFLDRGAGMDMWPVAMTEQGQRPVDFIEQLLSGDELDELDTCVWMTLEDYLLKRRAWIEAERARAAAKGYEYLPTAPPAKDKRF
jgi:hypothetical protein